MMSPIQMLYSQLKVAPLGEVRFCRPLPPTPMTVGLTYDYCDKGVARDGGVVMTRVYQILLIGEARHDPWQDVLEQVSLKLGCLEVTGESGTTARIREKAYDIIVIDATVVENMPDLIKTIRSQDVKVRIVVATASPAWEKAREAFRAGATDYIWKSMDKKRLLETLKMMGLRQM